MSKAYFSFGQEPKLTYKGITKDEWRTRYITHLVRLGLTQEMAEEDYEVGEEEHDYSERPEMAAVDSALYYDDDGE